MNRPTLHFDFGELSNSLVKFVPLNTLQPVYQTVALFTPSAKDRTELTMLSGGLHWSTALADSCAESSEPWACLFCGELTAVFGFELTRDCEGTSFVVPWCIADDRLRRAHPREFHRLARAIINIARRPGLPMMNHCWPDASREKWLKHLGFRFCKPRDSQRYRTFVWKP